MPPGHADDGRVPPLTRPFEYHVHPARLGRPARRPHSLFRPLRPDEFDITRGPVRHPAFGHGVHACPGAHLAREQVRVPLETLIGELPGPRSAAPVETLPSLIHRSPAEPFLAW